MLLLALACSSYDTSIDAFDAFGSDDTVRVSTGKHYVVFEPRESTEEVGVVFYPGGLVEPASYAPPLRLLANAGFTTALVSMPSNLAVYAPNRADRVLEEVDADRWVIAGHSLGGAMAASYADKNSDTLAGLALWAAYPAGGKDLSESGLGVLSITATEDTVLDTEKWEERKSLLPDDTTYVSIEGGNHAGFGDYGAQNKDGTATIEVEEQRQAIAEAMLDFLEAR